MFNAGVTYNVRPSEVLVGYDLTLMNYSSLVEVFWHC